MSFKITDDATTLSVQWDGRPVFDYVYIPKGEKYEGLKPRFRLYSPGGDLLTLFKPHDHPWHYGLAMTLTELSGHNFWGGPTFIKGLGYQDRDNQGSQQHQGWMKAPAGGPSLNFSHKLKWVTFQGETLLEEERRISAEAPTDEDAWLINFESTLTNVSGRELEIGSPTTQGREMAGYMGLMWRGPRAFHYGKVLSPHGVEPKDPMGERYPWLAYLGQHDESLKSSTFAFCDDPRNPRYPNRWFIRTDPFAIMSCAFAFSEVLPFAAGASLPLHYRILAADGAWDVGRVGSAFAS
jgi:hypothetical protein